MNRYDFPHRPTAAIPPVVLSDDDIVRAQAHARRARSEAFARAIRWSADTIRRFAA